MKTFEDINKLTTKFIDYTTTNIYLLIITIFLIWYDKTLLSAITVIILIIILNLIPRYKLYKHKKEKQQEEKIK